jgi:hypothetical protein
MTKLTKKARIDILVNQLDALNVKREEALQELLTLIKAGNWPSNLTPEAIAKGPGKGHGKGGNPAPTAANDARRDTESYPLPEGCKTRGAHLVKHLDEKGPQTHSQIAAADIMPLGSIRPTLTGLLKSKRITKNDHDFYRSVR